jgi:hypothetical protein
MATSNSPGVASESEEGLAHLLEQTIYARALKDLEDKLPEILHSAVKDGILTAAKNAPPRADAKPAATTQTKTKAVSRPASGGRCAQVWDELDKAVAKGKTPTLQDVTKLAERKKWNGNTARIQFYRWKHAQPAQAST